MLDTLIRGAKIIDGTGKAAFNADVGIRDGMIEAVGNLPDVQAFSTIEAAGRCLTPGFIDMHRHADAAVFRKDFGRAELCQGLTTIVNGNCGMSLAPLAGKYAPACARYLAPITGEITPELRFDSLASYFKAAQSRGLPLSCAQLAGMGTLRTLAAGFEADELSPLEMREMHYHMEKALADGACGVSLGLGYAPEIFYSTDGLIRALAPLYQSGVPICVHMRQEGDGVVDALREQGKKVGLLKIRCMRPFPSKEVTEIVKNAKFVGVLEKDISFGFEGVVYTDVCSALKSAAVDVPAANYVGGLGGRSIYKTDIEKIYEELLAGTAKVGEASFVNLRRDICGA